MAMQIASTAFVDGGEMPAKFTCEGSDVSPQISFSGVPAGAKSLVLIVDDPDAPDPAAPKLTWVHWVLFNLPPDTTELAEGVASFPAGTNEGVNDFNRTRFGGPCPPIGRHRYFFKLYALDAMLPNMAHPNKTKVLAAMEGHVLEQAQIVGTYQKAG